MLKNGYFVRKIPKNPSFFVKVHPTIFFRLFEGGGWKSLESPMYIVPFATAGHVETVRVLLEFNADADLANVAGQTPVQRLLDSVLGGGNAGQNGAGMGAMGSAQDEACLALLMAACGQPAVWTLYRRLSGRNEGDFDGPPDHRAMGPPRLLQLGRHAVRRNLRRGRVPELVVHLHLPDQLKVYLALGAVMWYWTFLCGNIVILKKCFTVTWLTLGRFTMKLCCVLYMSFLKLKILMKEEYTAHFSFTKSHNLFAKISVSNAKFIKIKGFLKLMNYYLKSIN